MKICFYGALRKLWSNAKNYIGSMAKRSFWLWLIFLISLSAVLVVAVYVFLIKYQKTLPALESLERIEPALVTRVYDKDSQVVFEFFSERRIWTPYHQLPPMVVAAVTAIEDREFFSHWGLNLRAYPAALLPALLGKRPRGASTLTQQLAKNLFLSPERSVDRKIREAMLAVQIERTYTKKEILEFYLNQVYLGAGAYGFAAAAQKYFSKTLDSLSIDQIALLAGLLQRPEAYRPDRDSLRAMYRRNTVLSAMAGEGHISKKVARELIKKPLNTKIWQPEAERAGYFIETVRQKVEYTWGENWLYGQGAGLYTTLDLKIQEAAENSYKVRLAQVRKRMMESANWRMRIAHYLNVPDTVLYTHWDSLYALFDSTFIHSDLEKARRANGEHEVFPDSIRYRMAEAAIIVIDNQTGAIRALVGGNSFVESKFNRAVQALRSPGSAFKPIVYTAAIDNGASPSDSISDQPITIPDPVNPENEWRPKNYDGKWDGNMSYRQALYKSKNLPAIQIALKYGLGSVVSYARRFGLTHNIPEVPSMAIGAVEATLLEMTSAYTVFPNLGIRPEPHYLTSVVDRQGQVFFQHIPKVHETIRKETAFIMTDMLRDVNRRGTAASVAASGWPYPSGGKTGTTNNYTDAWYIGFTAQYTTGIWVGVDNNMPLGNGHTGTQDALPMWMDIMTKIHEGLEPIEFHPPQGVVRVELCRNSGKIAGPNCSLTSSEWAISGQHTMEECDGVHSNTSNNLNSDDAFHLKSQKAPRSLQERKQLNSF